MKFILRLLLSALAVVLLANILPGVHVDTFGIAVIVALVLTQHFPFNEHRLFERFTTGYMQALVD